MDMYIFYISGIRVVKICDAIFISIVDIVIILYYSIAQYSICVRVFTYCTTVSMLARA